MRWKAAVFALTLLSVPAVWAAVLPVGVTAQASPAAFRGEWSADTRNTWRDNDEEPRVQFNLRTNAGDSRWGFGVRLRELAGLPASALSGVANDIQFTWTREAGAFRFTGSFDDGRGNGTYAFSPNQAFVTNMGSLGYRNLTSDDLVRLAVIDVTTAHVRGLGQAGYATLPLDDLIKTRIHRVTPEFVRDLAGVGYKNVAIEDLVRMAIHGATPANIKALQDAGIRGQSVDDVIRLRIHKVTPEFIRALGQRGYRGVPAEDLVRMRIHKVTPEEIDALKTLGFSGLSIDQLVKFRIHKVTPAFIRHAREDGLTVRTPGEAVDLAIHGPRWRKRR